MRGASRPASREELARLMPAVAKAHLFSDVGSLTAWWEEAPWRVRVTDAGSAVVLGRWREHLPYLAILGVWCPQRQLAGILGDVMRVASGEGFTRVIGPLVPEEAAGPYREAGFEPAERIVMCRLAIRDARAPEAVEGVRVREGGPADGQDVLGLDARCFDDFWRYDAPTLRAVTAGSHLLVAERDGAAVGYALAGARGSEGTLARLGVVPEERRRGIGSALVRSAEALLAADGSRAVTLTTQEGNEGSRLLYRREGFRESPGRLVYTVSPSADEAGGAAGMG